MPKERTPIHLPTKQEHEHGLNSSPLDAIINGALDLAIVTPSQGLTIRQSIRHEYADLFAPEEMRRNAGYVMRLTAEYAQHEIAGSLGVVPNISYHATTDGAEDIRIKELLTEGQGKTNRVVLMDKKKAFLAVGYELSDHYRVRLKVYDPRHPKHMEIMRNREVQDATRSGYVVISRNPAVEEGIDQEPSRMITIFPGTDTV